jgi:DNA-binding transcriptional LysR family regulator
VTDPTRDVADLRVADLLTFLAVVRSSSLTAAARERRVTPSQVSKAITRVETHFTRKLVERGSRGVVLSEAGRLLAPALEAIVTQLEAARAASPDGAEITLGAPSYLQTSLLPVLGSAAANVRIRSFELPPSLLRANAQDDGFDILLIPGGGEHLPGSWVSEQVGEIRRGLFASPVLRQKLGKGAVSIERLAEVPFIIPIFRQQGRVVPVDDDFPLPRAQRKIGHQVQTFLVGLEVAAQTEQLAFGPAIAAHRHVSSGALVEIPIEGYAVTDPLTFACNVDRVSARLRTAFVNALRTAMADLSTSAAR